MMEKDKDIRKKLTIPFLYFILSIAVCVKSIFTGVAHHETWAIVMAAISGTAIVAFVALIMYTVVKHKRKTV